MRIFNDEVNASSERRNEGTSLNFNHACRKMNMPTNRPRVLVTMQHQNTRLVILHALAAG
jgi:hypothetical protein